jgi:hypothetical protein
MAKKLCQVAGSLLIPPQGASGGMGYLNVFWSAGTGVSLCTLSYCQL